MIDRHRSSLSNKVHHEFLPKKSKAVLAILFIVFFSLYVFNVCTYLAKYVAALKEVLCLTCCSWKALITSPVGFTSDLSTDVTAYFIYFSYTNHPSTTPCSMMLHYITRFSYTCKLQLTYLGELGATGVRGKV